MIALDAKLARTVDSTTELNNGVYSLGFLNSSCTGVQISKMGHVLTARHCIEDSVAWGEMLAQKQALKFIDRTEISRAPYLVRLKYIDSVLRDQFQVPLGLDNKIVYGTLFFSGVGQLVPRFTSELKDVSLRAIHAQWADQGYSDGGDFAVVLIPALKGHKCLKLADRPIEVGERVHSISYPCFKRSGDWPTRRSGKVSHSSLSAAQEPGEFRITKGNFIVDHDAVNCNSGSPVLNSQGEVTGVLHAVFPSGVSMVLHTQRALQLMSVRERQIIETLNQACEPSLP
jgi:hypothetical protein